MPNRPLRLAAPLLLVSALAACSPPGTTLPMVGYVGGGPLPLDVLAVTSKDADTGNTSFRVNVKWSAAPGAKNYEVFRKFGTSDLKVLTTTEKTDYLDTSLAAGQAATYKIRAVGGDGKEVRSSEEKATTMLAQEVGSSVCLEPSESSPLTSADAPTFKWTAATKANLYHVRVSKLTDDSAVFSATTKETSIKFADKSPVAFDKFPELFAVGNPGGIQKGIIYRWTVQALRTDTGTDPAAVRAVDMSTSAPMKFSQQ